MTCTECGSPTVSFEVPESVREYAPSEGRYAAVCSRCLHTQPATDEAGPPAFDRVDAAIPDGEGAVAFVLAVGLLDSLALNRAAITALCEHAERHGVDVLLTLDRLASADGVEPQFDLDRRRTQLAQLLA
jgi:hypothetical protein